MRRSILVNSVIVILLIIGIPIASAKSGASDTRVREDARYILKRTSPVLQRAERTAETAARHHSDGDHHLLSVEPSLRMGLARAHAMQEKAKDLYIRGMYRESINLSLGARFIAFQVLEWVKPPTGAHPLSVTPELFDERESVYWEEGRNTLGFNGDFNGFVMIGETEHNPFVKYDF